MTKIRGQIVYPLQDRLNRLSKLNAATGCIEFTSTLRNGYGRLVIGSRSDNSRKSVSAPRLAYELVHGAIPKGMEVCHKCDNRKCINPEHLFIGSHQDNIDDRERKGRNKFPRKLSDKQVELIHAMRLHKTSHQLAVEFGVCRDSIKKIWSGKVYPHLKPLAPEPPSSSLNEKEAK